MVSTVSSLFKKLREPCGDEILPFGLKDSVLLPNWVPYCDTHARGPYSLVKIGEGWGGWVSAERYRCIGFPYDFHHSLRTFRSNSVRIVPEFPMILGGGVGGSGILFIGWVGSPGWCRSKVGTPAKEQNPGRGILAWGGRRRRLHSPVSLLSSEVTSDPRSDASVLFRLTAARPNGIPTAAGALFASPILYLTISRAPLPCVQSRTGTPLCPY